MGKPCNKFTKEQIEILQGSRHVRSVGEDMVYFTDEFKQLCWQMYNEENMMPKEILRRLGVDYHILGKPRVRGLFHGLKKWHNCNDEIGEDGSCERQTTLSKKHSAEQKLERLSAENEYLKQELEFVKKIIAAGMEVER